MGLKIAVICTRYIHSEYHTIIGGAEINTHGILRELAKKYEVTVLTPFRIKSRKEETLNGVKVKRFWNIFNPFSRYPYMKKGRHLCPGIIKESLKEKYDLIHIYPGISITNMPYLLPKWIKNKPLFLTVYDLMKYSLIHNYRSLTLDKLNFFTKQALRQFDSISAISSYELRVIREINENSFYLPCGVDIEEFDNHDRQSFREKFDINSEFLILDISRIEEYKGQHILIEAIPDIVKEEKDVCFSFVGSIFNEQYYLKLRNLVKELGVERYVLFTGSVEWKDVLNAYFDCDLHVLPAYFLTFPDTVIEAWAARKPVVVSNRIDFPWIKEGEEGFTFDIKNRKELVERVLTLLHDKKLRKQMGERGRKKVEENFKFQMIADKIENVYNKVLLGKVK